MVWPKDPSELKHLSEEDCRTLAEAVRELIVSTVSKTGGHLASSLGTVELTLALMRVFDFSEDQDAVVWDVGHQSYPWKILTGRADSFSTLRQNGGLAGFPKRDESPFDYFNTGHASTSISAAQGMARAKQLRGQDGRVIAVIGDGALTGGLAFEAMNNLQRENLIVILNDNQMAIDENVGSLVRHLDELRIHPQYLHLKATTQNRLRPIPLIGPAFLRHLTRMKATIRQRLHHMSSLFETMGFRYYGPVDGHDQELLERYLKAAKGAKRPVLIHLLTQKGRGYHHAEATPRLYHGVSPFIEENGIEEPEPLLINRLEADEYFAKPVSYTQGFSWAVHKLASECPDLVTITAAMPSGTGLRDFSQTWPERFYDVGIAEGHAVTLSAGLAAGGKKPIVAIYSTFLQRALDQVHHDVALQNLPVFFAVDRAGLVGEDGETHQGIYDLNFLDAIPNLEIWTASDPQRLASRLDTLYRELDHPVMLRYSRGKASLPKELQAGYNDPALPSDMTHRRFDFGNESGSKHFVVLSYGNYVGEVAEAVRAFVLTYDVHVTLLDIEKIKPLQIHEFSDELMQADGILIAEENSGPGPLTRGIVPYLYETGLQIPLVCRYLPDQPIEQGSRTEQLTRHTMDPKSLVRDLESLYEGRRA